MNLIHGNTVGNTAPIKTLTIVDASGNECVGVIVDSEVIFTASAEKDIREGKVAATDEGVVVGKKVIPSCITSVGTRKINAGQQFKLTFYDDRYDYTKMQALICMYGTSINNSVTTDRVVIDNLVYPVNSSDIIATVTKNDELMTIDFGIKNESEHAYIIRYFSYKEVD